VQQRPVAGQFLYSLEKYIISSYFQPAEELTMNMIDAMFKKRQPK
jgi:hypothetical protein